MDMVFRTQVRPCDCDSLGHANNSVYVCYLTSATVEVFGQISREVSLDGQPDGAGRSVADPAGTPALDLRQLTMEYQAPARSGDDLEVAVWPDGSEDGQLACLYSVRRAFDRQQLLRAWAVWAVRDPRPHEDRRPTCTLDHDTRPKPLRLPPDHLGGHSFRWQHIVRHYEVGQGGCVRPVEVLRWLEETKFAACSQVGWSVERMTEAGFVTVQVRHDTRFFDSLAFGDSVEIISRLYGLRRVQGTWQHQVYRGAQLVALDYSTGAFLDTAGQLSPAPEGMMEALLRGRAA